MLIILYVISRLHLNKIMALSIQNLCIPPFVPLICIELGHYLLYRTWLTEVSFNIIFGQLHQRLGEWFLGSLIVAPLMAILVGLIVFFIAKKIEKLNFKINYERQ
jgi:hypothetical protein